jgi:hypothetical protein
MVRPSADEARSDGASVCTARRFIDGQAVVDVMPIVGCCVSRIDAERFYNVDPLQHALNLGPAGQPQQDLAAGAHIGHGRAALAGRDSPDDVDARDDRTKIARSPAHERDYAAWRKRQDPPPSIENLFLGGVVEANPILDALLEPQNNSSFEI